MMIDIVRKVFVPDSIMQAGPPRWNTMIGGFDRKKEKTKDLTAESMARGRRSKN